KLAIKSHENTPALWLADFPVPAQDTHKYRRGHVGVFSGGPSATGAARLAALGAARSGAGAVTVLSSGNAMQVNAAHLTSIMLRNLDNAADLDAYLNDKPPSAFVLGPGFGVGEKAQKFALAVLGDGQDKSNGVEGLVLDADGITSFRDAPASLFITAGAK